MARGIATTRTACAIAGTWLVLALTALAAAQTPSAAAHPAADAALVSKACAPGAAAQNGEQPLPNVAAALAAGRPLRILSIGAAPGRLGRHGHTYTTQIEDMLQAALKVTRIEIINRGVSGELAAAAAVRMRNEVALEEPDLVLWQVGTNDALAYVPADDFAQTVRDQVAWLKAHKVDVVLVGLQFAPQMLRDAHYVKIRETLRAVAAQENVISVRFFEAMEILNRGADAATPAADEFERSEAGYNCLSQYVARAITLGVFARHLPNRQPNPPAAPQGMQPQR
jgi:lysophospholipase L1-like esterase